MASRRDQLHSYQFMMQRVISSVMVHEPDPEQTPLRRGTGAAFAGVMLAALVAIGFGVYGVISGNQANRWQTEGAVIIERETGAQYVYQGGVLQPVLNYTSARLISQSLPAPPPQAGLLGIGGGVPTSQPQRVASRNLAGIPRAVPVGIPNAPDSLPPAERVVGAPWTMCSVLGRDPAGEPVTETTLLVGAEAPGGEPLGQRALLVVDAEEGTRYLLWHSHRYRITGSDPDQVIRSLYGATPETADVGAAWLNAIPSGPDIGPVGLSGVGVPSPAVAGRRVGDVVFHPVAGGEQYYLVRQDGLAPVTELQVLLLRGRYGIDPEEIPAAEANAAPASDALAPADGGSAPPETPPEVLPAPVDGQLTLCAETTDARAPPLLYVGGDLAAESALPTAGRSQAGTRLVDAVVVPPGRIAVVRAVPSEASPIGAYYLVSDLGLRFPVPSPEVLGMLGYLPTHAVDMPAALVQRLPEGPTLTPEAARQPVAPGQ